MIINCVKTIICNEFQSIVYWQLFLTIATETYAHLSYSINLFL